MARDRRMKAVALVVLCLSARAGYAGDAPTAWDNSPVGECVGHYKVPRPTADYPVAVQRIGRADVHKNRYVWVWDPTPAKNPTRQLVRISPRNVGCTILFMPFSEFHDFALTRGGALPQQVTSTSATVNDERGAYAIEQVYLFAPRTGMYGKTPSCYRVRIGRAEKENVECGTE